MTNNTFSSERFLKLFRQSLRINKKIIWTTVAGVAGTIFFSLLTFQALGGFRTWKNESSYLLFVFFFISLGTVYASLSFPSFRSSEKSVDYLMVPASIMEKFFHEIVTRIIAFVLIMPLIFWITANIESAIVHYYRPAMPGNFSFREGWLSLWNIKPVPDWTHLLFLQFCLFFLVSAFTGAVHFSKSPLIKTLFAFTLIFSFYVLFSWLLFKGLNLEHYSHGNKGFLFINNEKEAYRFFTFSVTTVNLVLMVVSWFRLKEKEA